MSHGVPGGAAACLAVPAAAGLAVWPARLRVLGVGDARVPYAVSGRPDAACLKFDAVALVAETLVEGDCSFVFGHDPQVGVFVRVDDGLVECLTEPGAVRVVERVQVRELTDTRGQFGQGVGAFEFPVGVFAE